MSNIRLTRVVTFAAAHRYFRPDWSPERNLEVFGPCAREHGHGHSYECRVTVRGPVARDTSMVVNLSDLDRILREEIIERFDHRHLNHDVAEFAFGQEVPTVEALAMHIWKRVAARLPTGVELDCVRVQEEPGLYAEFRGDA